MLKRHICLLTLPRHCVVPETLTTILIEKCSYVMVMRWCGQHKIQTAQCRLGTKHRLQTRYKTQTEKKNSFLFSRQFCVFTVTPSKIKMQTSQYRKSRIWEMKEDNMQKSLANNHVCAIIPMRDIRKNVLPKFIRLCMETPRWCPFEGHTYGRRKPTETYVFLVFLY